MSEYTRKIRTERGGPGCTTTWYYLIGDKGAVQFMFVSISLDDYEMRDGLDLGYHSLEPMYSGQEGQEKCEALDGRPCYYDGSGVSGQALYKKFLETQDPEAIWKELEKYYGRTFAQSS